jgi:hypothetical protein
MIAQSVKRRALRRALNIFRPILATLSAASFRFTVL